MEKVDSVASARHVVYIHVTSLLHHHLVRMVCKIASVWTLSQGGTDNIKEGTLVSSLSDAGVVELSVRKAMVGSA